MKKAIITGGASFHQGFFTSYDGKYANFFDERIYAPDLDESTDFSQFDYILVASRIDTRFLKKHAAKFIKYLENGGHLVIFGEDADAILPNVKFKRGEVNFWWWLNKQNDADLPLLPVDENDKFWKFMKVSTCKWHYHGVFQTPKEAKKILCDELGAAIIYEDDASFKGKYYLTSLDPEFHIGQGFMPTTEPFFDNFMKYVESDIMERK